MIIFFLITVILSAVIHEYAHGWAADQLGDPTARLAGRLTINPIAHIDLWGTLLLPFFLYTISGGSFMFGYAKPVPYNPYNLKDKRFGPAMVGAAGPLSNIVLAVIFGLMMRAFPGSILTIYFSVIVYVNILLAVFNLVPIPPLDGSKILFAILPDSMHNFKVTLERFGFFILIFFIFFAFQLILPIIHWLYGIIAGTGGAF